jgi:hypothetical protein
MYFWRFYTWTRYCFGEKLMRFYLIINKSVFLRQWFHCCRSGYQSNFAVFSLTKAKNVPQCFRKCIFMAIHCSYGSKRNLFIPKLLRNVYWCRSYTTCKGKRESYDALRGANKIIMRRFYLRTLGSGAAGMVHEPEALAKLIKFVMKTKCLRWWSDDGFGKTGKTLPWIMSMHCQTWCACLKHYWTIPMAITTFTNEIFDAFLWRYQ